MKNAMNDKNRSTSIVERFLKTCAPTEIRTPVLALKGLRPSPLDDGGELRDFTIAITAGQGWDNYIYFAEYFFPIIN